MKILVTGGAGFIGSVLVRKLVMSTMHQVLNVDKLTYAGNKESIIDLECYDTYRFEQADIINRSEMDRIFKNFEPDAVMHLAAQSHVDRSIASPGDFIQTNIIGTYNLLEAARLYWGALDDLATKEAFRFHHISTDEVFGDLDDGTRAFTENTAYAPSSPYSASKASSDHLVRAWHRTFGLPTIISNCSNNYGPYQFPEKLIPLTIFKALRHEAIPIYGSGEQIRDWLYVEDHVDALYTVLTTGKVGETYNIGGHNEIKNIEVVQMICDILEEVTVNEAEKYFSLINHVEDRPGHDRRYAVDANKIKNELMWVPKESFNSGLRKTVLWYLSNTEWIDRILDSSYKSPSIGSET